LNLAEDRRGGLLVVLDDPEMAASLASRTDLYVTSQSWPTRGRGAKAPIFNYLLHQKRIMDVPSAVLETVARIDGGIVLDSHPTARLRGHPTTPGLDRCVPETIEGGRTTAAISASRFGNVLKISEDGLISFFQNGRCSGYITKNAYYL